MWLCIGCFCDCGEYDGVDDVHDNKDIKSITDDINIGLEYLIFLFVVVIKYVLCEYQSARAEKLSRQDKWTVCR